MSRFTMVSRLCMRRDEMKVVCYDNRTFRRNNGGSVILQSGRRLGI